MPYFTSRRGHKIFYQRYGQAGPVIILIHGIASSGRIWLRQIKALKDEFQLYVIDLPGHGKSDRWPTYSLEAFAELLKEWAEDCGIKQGHIVALSLGCTVALTFACRYPDRVSSLILEGPVNGYRPWWNPLGWLDWLVFKSLPILLQVSITIFGYRATSHWLNTFGVNTDRSIKMLEALQNQVDFNAVRQLLWENICPPYIGKLNTIPAPTLIIRGINDPMPKRFVRYLQKHLPNATLVEIPQTRHLVALEKPIIFNQLIKDFIRGNFFKKEENIRQKLKA